MSAEKNFVSRVYFPKDCTRSKSGWLIGWNISNFISCVATVVEEREEKMSIERLKDATRSMSADPSLQDVWSYCSCPPTILGRWSTNMMTNAEHADSMFWLEMYPELSRPALRAVFCVGSRYHTTSKIILYDRTENFEFFSGKESTLQRGHPTSSRHKLTVFEYTLRQCNAARWVSDMIVYRTKIPSTSLITNKTQRKKVTHHYKLVDLFIRIGFLVILCFRLLLGAVRSLLSCPILGKNNLCAIQISLLCKQLHFRSTSLIYILSQSLCRCDNESSFRPYNNLRNLNKSHKSDVLLHSSDNGTTSGEGFESSNVEDEVDDKSLAFSEFHSKDDMRVPVWHDPEAIARERINYNGEIFRIILDITLGIVAGFYLFSHSSSTDIPVTYLRLVMSTLQQSMDSNIEWLMGVPVGMKLNQPLTRQLGRLVLSVLRVWAHVMEILVKSYGSNLIVLISLTGMCGLGFTAMLSLLTDLTFLFTAHVFTMYRFFCLVQSFQLHMLSSLWKLFRGKKANILRKRVDHCDYSREQLMVGTLLFTVFLFLFLTVSVYYTFLTATWLCVLGVRSSLWIVKALIWYFPYYELYMYIRNPMTFPGGGVRIEIVRTENRRETSYLELKANRAPIGALFWRLKQQLKHFRAAYSSRKIVDCLVYAKSRWLDGVQRLCMVQYPGICNEDLRAPRMFWRDMTRSYYD